MFHVVTTGAYYPPVVTTWKILTTGASQLTAVSLCTGTHAESNPDQDTSLKSQLLSMNVALLVRYLMYYSAHRGQQTTVRYQL